MLRLGDNLNLSVAAVGSYQLRAALTILGLTMGIATLITVVTLIQGANLYVEQKIANLGTNVFRISRLPFAVTDFSVIIKALRYKRIRPDDVRAVATGCQSCAHVGATGSSTARVKYGDQELQDINVYGHTANMAEIDTRTVLDGRYFTSSEEQRGANVCLVGDTLVQQLFGGGNALGRVLRIANQEFTVIGVFEKIGSVLGQEQDNFVVIPLDTFLRFRGARQSLTIHVKAASGAAFLRAQDESRLLLRARRHVPPGADDDFFIATNQSYMALWQSISQAFFAVLLMVSSISAVVGGIVIMNVMLVSVTERTKEIGIRRAVGATQNDIRRQFLAESVLQCIVGGVFGIAGGFLQAVALRVLTAFPAAVETWVAVLGVGLSSGIGLFFGIYPAVRASRLDPVVALRAD